MEGGNGLYPPWLKRLLNTEFYGDNNICEKHNHYCRYFCTRCITKPLCELCWKVDGKYEHEGHHYLQTRRVSVKASVVIADIERDVDVREIQPYIINSQSVVLLKSKGRKNDRNPNCVICQGKVKDQQYRFCSISCKIRGDKERLRVGLGERENVEEIVAESSTQTHSLRTKPRKRTPCRSPLF